MSPHQYNSHALNPKKKKKKSSAGYFVLISYSCSLLGETRWRQNVPKISPASNASHFAKQLRLVFADVSLQTMKRQKF
jgi:hypothetical protein